MEVFRGVHLVRLRCVVRDREYLTADEDARGVRLTTNRHERATIWAVELVDRSVLLRGDYGGYLSLERTDGLPGAVLAGQRLMPVGDPAPPEMLWRAARRDGHVVLRNRVGGYLRANGRYLSWRTDVTVADDGGSSLMLWSVEVVPLGLRSVVIDAVLHQQGYGNEQDVTQDMQSIKENDKRSQEQSLVELQLDCLVEIAIRLPSRADILRLAASSRHLWITFGSRYFKEAYYSANGTSMAELIGVLNTREIQVMALSAVASAPISLNGLHIRFGMHIIDCHGGLLLLKDDPLGAMIIYDPTNGRSVTLFPPSVLEEHEFVSAVIAPDTSDQYSVVISLYANGSSNLFGQNKVWIATSRFYPGVTKWTVFDHEIDFDLKAVEIKPPSIIAEREWHLLNYNSFVISVFLDAPHTVRTQPLPFRRQLLTPSHILGRTKQCQLALVARQDGDLMAWEYNPYNPIKNESLEAREYKRFKEFPQIPFFAFAQENLLLLSDHLISFNMETGQFELPFIIPAEEMQATRHVITYEMAWPPRPVLQARPPKEDNIPLS